MGVKGFCREGFAPVLDAFVASLDAGLELGACVAVTLDGVPVVDLWAGDARPDGAPWEEDTIVNVYSTTKTMAATSVLVLADRGLVDLSAPVATYWPEFAQNGKENVLVSHVMSHSAGLSGFDPPLERTEERYDWAAMTGRVAAQPPWWEPGAITPTAMTPARHTSISSPASIATATVNRTPAMSSSARAATPTRTSSPMSVSWPPAPPTSPARAADPTVALTRSTSERGWLRGARSRTETPAAHAARKRGAAARDHHEIRLNELGCTAHCAVVGGIESAKGRPSLAVVTASSGHGCFLA